MKIRKSFVDLVLLGLTLATVLVVFAGSGFARTLGAGLLLFVLPGYAVLAAWFPHRLIQTPGNILLTLTMSMAAVAIGGLVLNFLPWGLEFQTWILWLGGLTLLNTGVAFLRDVRHADNFIFGNSGAFRIPQALLLVMAGALAFGAIAVARIGAVDQPRLGFTQLWMLQIDKTNNAQLGIQNDEGVSTTYQLIVQRDGVSVQSYYDIEVAPGQKWETKLQLPLNTQDETEPFEAMLYRADNPESIYRSVSLWFSNDNSK